MWHGFSWKFHIISFHRWTVVWSTLTPNSMTIPCYLCRFDLFSPQKHDMDFGQAHVMESPWHLLRKWRDFHRIWSHFRPNCRQKDMRKSLSHFWQGTRHKYKKNDKIEIVVFPVKNVTAIFSWLFAISLLENETKSDGNPTIFYANSVEIPWRELF